MRTASSASTRLRLSARSRPINSAAPDSFTSAFGALATIAWSRSRTMMSRMRTAMRIRPARSICVPPTSTVLPWPIFSSIAAASHGVAISRLIGPAPSRHHSAPKEPAKITIRAAITMARRFTQRSPASHRRSAREAVTEPMQYRSSIATAAGERDDRPPRHGRDPNRHHPTARAGRQHADLTPGATYSLPLPLGAGADCEIDRRQGLARRYVSSAPVPASLPILD